MRLFYICLLSNYYSQITTLELLLSNYYSRITTLILMYSAELYAVLLLCSQTIDDAGKQYLVDKRNWKLNACFFFAQLTVLNCQFHKFLPSFIPRFNN
jgi:hypothetical protein